MNTVLDRLRKIPTRRDWLELLGFAVVFIGLALPFGLIFGVISFQANPSLERVAIFTFYSIFIPAFAEEFVFRGLLLPDKERGMAWGSAVVSVAAYVAWHPLVAWTILPSARALYFDPFFLVIVAGLGCVLTISVLRSRSLWPAVTFHWLVVVSWKAVLGGEIFLI